MVLMVKLCVVKLLVETRYLHGVVGDYSNFVKPVMI